MIPPAGKYEGELIKGKFQLGETNEGTLQLALDIQLFNGQESVGAMTTTLYFSDKAAAYSYERLRLLGWQGTGADDIDKLDDCTKRVPCTVKAPEQYKDPRDGTIKMGNAKLEIDGAAATFTISKPLTADAFKARLKAVGGPGGSSTSTGGGTPPPF